MIINPIIIEKFQLFTLAVIICGLISCHDKNETVGLSFEPSQLDLGTIEQGSSRTILIKLINNTKENLVLNGIQTSCGCTAVRSDSGTEFERQIILPKQAIPVNVVVKAPTYPGSFTPTIAAVAKNGNQRSLIAECKTRGWLVPKGKISISPRFSVQRVESEENRVICDVGTRFVVAGDAELLKKIHYSAIESSRDIQLQKVPLTEASPQSLEMNSPVAIQWYEIKDDSPLNKLPIYQLELQLNTGSLKFTRKSLLNRSSSSASTGKLSFAFAADEVLSETSVLLQVKLPKSWSQYFPKGDDPQISWIIRDQDVLCSYRIDSTLARPFVKQVELLSKEKTDSVSLTLYSLSVSTK